MIKNTMTSSVDNGQPKKLEDSHYKSIRVLNDGDTTNFENKDGTK